MKQALVFFLLAFFAFSLNAQTQVTGLPNQLTSTYEYDALQFSVGNHLYVGGKSSQGPLTWNAYPGSQQDEFRFRYSNTNATQLTYSDWNGLWQFKVSNNTPSYGGVVSWKTIMYINRWDQVGVNGDFMVNNGSLTMSDGGNTLLSIDNGDVVSNIPLIIADNELSVRNSTGDTEFKVNALGEVRCRAVKVDLDPIPDYVFEDDYNLITIEELEAYIQKEKHLPNIPSANDYKEEGAVDIGELNRLLLEKTEEQALYIIEMNKEVKELEKDNKELLERLEKIEAALKLQEEQDSNNNQ